MIRALALAVLTALALAGPSQAEALPDVQTDRIMAVTYGIYCVGPEVDRQEAPGTVSGHIGIMGGEPRLVHAGKTVPALLGISFGVEWMPDYLGVPFVSMKVTRPLPDGTIVTETWETDALPGQMKANFFTFDLPEELALGTWTFEAFARDELLWRVSFEVIDPLSFPNPNIPCIGMVS